MMPISIPRTYSATQIPTQVSSTGLALQNCSTEHLVAILLCVPTGAGKACFIARSLQLGTYLTL